ncbi:hypothetical protein PsAD2_01300 [Pseudovibrio axinellae]|uniref:Uncharacterized protein n=1 Tax=Pseudovibrio axinellae TaxID=989403 RepID=A0A161V7C5_9HYPH|nr:hypothetical protein [Pseudovibrio axinellae]KZL20811.1 hypothetical protein PsAD2_01300 [Pseudovibrio axinellae]SER21818.1 hypothetical protein SAMN05421798_10776 [Pseudovibrio axinellae]
MSRLLGAVLALLIASGVSFASGLMDENLLVGMPEGYKVAFSQNKNGLLVSEMIPRGQSLKTWRDMVTVQIHFSRRVKMKMLEKQYTQVKNPICKQHDGRLLKKGRENGYEFGMFLTRCTTTPASKSETVLTKAILGNDSTYFVIKSWRSKVGKAEIAKWSRYLSRVKVCDSRIAGRVCP